MSTSKDRSERGEGAWLERRCRLTQAVQLLSWRRLAAAGLTSGTAEAEADEAAPEDEAASEDLMGSKWGYPLQRRPGATLRGALVPWTAGLLGPRGALGGDCPIGRGEQAAGGVDRTLVRCITGALHPWTLDRRAALAPPGGRQFGAGAHPSTGTEAGGAQPASVIVRLGLSLVVVVALVAVAVVVVVHAIHVGPIRGNRRHVFGVHQARVE